MNEDIKKAINELIIKNELQEAKLKALEYHKFLMDEHSDLRMMIYDIMLKEGDWEGAEKVLKGWLKMDPGNYKYLRSLGDISVSKKDFYSARVYYTLAKKNCTDLGEIERLSNVISSLEPDARDKRINKKLVILDDYFPNLKTGFRISEYNYYLGKYPNCEIYSSDSYFYNNLKEYESYFPEFKNRIKPMNINNYGNYPCSLFYTVFLNNVYNFLPIVEMNNIPFVFTLYPGGGFSIDDVESDRKLFTVCKSHLFKKMIVTQKITGEYVIKKGFTTPDKIKFIYGGVTYTDYFKEHLIEKKYYRQNKNSFDICFVAAKYMAKGIDKGFDIFIEVCKKLSKINPDVKFHVVGGFTEKDIDITEIKDRIQFYGMKNYEFFPMFYSGMDIIISPNRPFVLLKGAFDGFPTGCCVDAGLNGVAVLCTDPLNQNINFENSRDICLISTDAKEITDKVIYYINNPDKLYTLSSNGQIKLNEVYDIEKQMQERIQVLEEWL